MLECWLGKTSSHRNFRSALDGCIVRQGKFGMRGRFESLFRIKTHGVQQLKFDSTTKALLLLATSSPNRGETNKELAPATTTELVGSYQP